MRTRDNEIKQWPVRPLALPLLVVSLWNAQGAESNTPGPPPPPHWYQKVTPGITLHSLSPVEYFRGLLGMTPAERDRVLAGKSAEERTAVLAKIAEYEAMPAEVREARLHQTELHWRLMNLMKLPPKMREEQMRLISPLDQPMILTVLNQWDELPPKSRGALLEKESFLRTYLQWQGSTANGRQELLLKLSPGQRKEWAEELPRWQALPENQRAEWCDQFRRFFNLTDREQRDAIRSLSEAERRQMEPGLRTFALLPAGQRQLCIESFRKFATMSPAEQDQFLRNAEKWQAMSAPERGLWRRLVGELPPMPPLPPGFYDRLPPMPPGFGLSRATPETSAAKPPSMP